jgi:hypothetical protein
LSKCEATLSIITNVDLKGFSPILFGEPRHFRKAVRRVGPGAKWSLIAGPHRLDSPFFLQDDKHIRCNHPYRPGALCSALVILLLYGAPLLFSKGQRLISIPTKSYCLRRFSLQQGSLPNNKDPFGKETVGCVRLKVKAEKLQSLCRISSFSTCSLGERKDTKNSICYDSRSTPGHTLYLVLISILADQGLNDNRDGGYQDGRDTGHDAPGLHLLLGTIASISGTSRP